MTQKKILIVDDEPDIIDVVAKLLGEQNYVVVSASNGEDGIKAAKAEKPDLILMDIGMPGMGGFEAVEVLRADKEKDIAGIPILMLTVDTSQESIETGFVVGANGYVVKETMSHILLDRIARVLGI